MKNIVLAAILLTCLSSAADARGGYPSAGAPSAPSPDRRDYTAIAPTQETAPSNGITRNANDCPPDHAEAVWGADSALLGYTCVTPSAN
jgi:hypothetical protein